MERIIGDFGQKDSHTLVLVMGGIHGNETGGVVALEHIFDALSKSNPQFEGRFVGVRGNLKALKEGKRYIEEDLNRLWSDEVIHIARTHEHDHPEFEELAQLFQTFESLEFDNHRQKIFVDLHGTSADNGIFLIVKDYEEAEHIVKKLHAPVLLGLHRSLHNTTVPYMYEHGFLPIGFEGGKIGSQETVQNHELILWQILYYAGCIQKKDVPEHILEYDILKEFSSNLPPLLQLDYCHKIKEGDEFVMMSGFKNYDWVKSGDLLAHDRHGEIRSQYNGYILMPLYQKEGNDGFFIISKATNLHPADE